MSKDALYVMAFTAEGVEWSKVGRARDVQIRRKRLQQDKPFEVRLIKEFPERGALETQVLSKLSGLAERSSRQRGKEWFRVDASVALAVAEEAVASVPADAPETRPDGVMILKTSYYPRSQIARLKDLAKRLGVAEAVLLREALEARLIRG